MNRFRRLTLVLTLALAVALVSACKDQSSQSKSPAPAAAGAVAGGGGDPTQFIPADMDFILRVDWANTLSDKNNTEEVRKGFREGVTKALGSKDPMAAEIFQALDIDLLTDVQGLATGAKINPVAQDKGDAVIALKTKLQLEKLVSVLKEKAAGKVVIAPYDAGTVKGYQLSDPAGSPDKMFLASSGDVIVGTTTADFLTLAFDTQKKGTSSFKAGKLKDAMSLVDSSAQFIFVLDGTKIPKNPNSPPPMPGVDQIQVVAASLKYASQQYDLAIVARFPEAEIAKTLADQLTGLKGMFGGSPEMKPLADKVIIAASQTDLKINASITDKEIEDLQKQMEQKAPGMMPGQMPAGQ